MFGGKRPVRLRAPLALSYHSFRLSRPAALRPNDYAHDAGRVSERIAKEGRKYCLFLLVASQRPSELSKTGLSQYSKFVVHRIQNPDDLSQIRQMSPSISDGVLRRLPALPN